jgi:disulfide bond formation protein DsbB
MLTHHLINTIWVFLLCIILTAALFFHAPCPLCLMQRLSMVGIAHSALLNLKFGTKPRHYGFALLFALLGHYIGIHLAPGKQTLLGLTLPTWSSFVFLGSLLTATLLLIFYRDERPLFGKVEKTAYGCLLVITFGLIVSSI